MCINLLSRLYGKMNNTIDDFFNEISDLEQTKQPKPKQSVWQECYDELTGYSYYWNTKTDEVTWTTPSDFKAAKEHKKEKITLKKKELYTPPRLAPLLPSTSTKVPETSMKIYSISESPRKNSTSKNVRLNDSEKKKPQKKVKKPYKRNSDSEDEKIELISSYGGDTESESEEESDQPSQNETRKENDSNHSDDDDVDILTKIQKRAKELKEMGGDLPPEVENVIDTKETDEKPTTEKKNGNGFSLVAGYSDSEEEQENEEVKTIFSIPEPPKVAHSTLFPITKPIDVKDFIQQAPVENKAKSPSGDFDSKAFQRKRRIGVALVNTVKKKEEVLEGIETEAKGLGFKEEDTTSNAKENIYPGFRKGGVMFVKSDVLNPSQPKIEENTSAEVSESKTEEVCSVKQADLEKIYVTLMEKLGFLSEGRPQVSPVQVMIIQAETLFTAMKEKALKLPYLQRWLSDTHADLIKLEKEAAPEGWLLQWDRSHKRYYYQNQTTGESQWEYPQPDISRCDEAMDISTTPPPAEPAIHLSPPLPPSIRSPTPPPPPIISKNDDEDTETSVKDVPLPAESEPVSTKFVSDGEPLPPGVDVPEIVAYKKPKEKETKPVDPLFSALDSFYSDIASIENTNSSSPPPAPPLVEEDKTQSESSTEPPKKKKKTKVKLAPGLAMKKKGVSQLVEKWKSVQQHYND